MKKSMAWLVTAWVLASSLVVPVQAKDSDSLENKIGLRYRIEFLEKGQWKPVKNTKKFRKDDEIRFRFMGNVAGTMYLLNSSALGESLQPVFTEGSGMDLRRFLGLGTHIGAMQVGVVPNPDRGGSLRFTGGKNRERFLFVFIPDALERQRGMMAIPSGAEGWKFDAKTTYTTSGDPGNIIFHYFQLKSK